MKLLNAFLILAVALICASRTACAQLQVLPDQAVQCVFAGDGRKINCLWQNSSKETTNAKIHTRLYQTSSATVAPMEEKPWKEIQILSGQTVLETAFVDFPAVNAETKFLIQWLADSNQVIGKTEVLAYPTNLLSELKPMLGEDDLGVLDPNGALKPLLKQNGVRFLDLGEMALEDFSGKLAIVGPFSSKAQMREGLAETIQQIAKKGVAVVWIQPPAGPKDEFKPSFYLVPEAKGAVVVVQPELVADFSENPKSQLNLICCCKLALHPAPLPLPNLPPQP
jgi:hypothetical protein